MKSKPKISKAWDKMEIRNIQSAYDLKAERKTCKSEAMQMGAPQSGSRAAVFYTLMGYCHREGINAEAYLTDLFICLPFETNQTVHRLTPKAWAADQRARTLPQAKTCAATA